MVFAMLIKNEREHLNALVRTLSERAVRLDSLNRMSQEPPVIYDKTLQRNTVGEALEAAKELRDFLDEAVVLLEKDLAEELEVISR